MSTLERSSTPPVPPPAAAATAAISNDDDLDGTIRVPRVRHGGTNRNNCSPPAIRPSALHRRDRRRSRQTTDRAAAEEHARSCRSLTSARSGRPSASPCAHGDPPAGHGTRRGAGLVTPHWVSYSSATRGNIPVELRLAVTRLYRRRNRPQELLRRRGRRLSQKRCGAWAATRATATTLRLLRAKNNAGRQGFDPDRRGRSATRAVRHSASTNRSARRCARRGKDQHLDRAGLARRACAGSPARTTASPCASPRIRRDRAVRDARRRHIVSTSANRAGSMPPQALLGARSGRRRRRRWRAGSRTGGLERPARSRDVRTGARCCGSESSANPAASAACSAARARKMRAWVACRRVPASSLRSPSRRCTPPSRAEDVTIYRCTDARGNTTLARHALRQGPAAGNAQHAAAPEGRAETDDRTGAGRAAGAPAPLPRTIVLAPPQPMY